MILTVTANAAIDHTLTVDVLERGAKQRVVAERRQAGGKGVNVARVLAAAGLPVHAVVVVGGAAGRWILADLASAGIPATGVEAAGESRTCLELLERRSGLATQLHGTGVEADANVAGSLAAACRPWLDRASWLSISGSQARGLPVDTTARLVEEARREGVATAVDTSGPPLAAAVRAGPELVRVNRDEWREALATDGSRSVAPEPPLRPGSARHWVVSDGDRTVWAGAADGRRWEATPPRVALRNPVGCGDAMLAGMLAVLSAGGDFEEALRMGVALGAADAESETAGHPDAQRARDLAPRVELERSPRGGC